MKRAFTLVELMVSMAILAMVSGSIFSIIVDLAEEGERSKQRLGLKSEIVANLEAISKIVKEADSYKILETEIGKKDQKEFSSLLVTNSEKSESTSLFSLVKALGRELTEKELPTFPGEENYFLGISELNLFSDLAYEGDLGVIVSSPGEGKIYTYKDGNFTELLGPESGLISPSGLYVSQNNLFVSDTYGNAVYLAPLEKLKSSSQTEREKALKLIAGKIKDGDGKIGFEDGILGKNTLNKPKGLTLVSGENFSHLYIVDSGNNAVRILDLEKMELFSFLGNGKAGISKDGVFNGEFLLDSPTDIDYSPENSLLLVTDTNNNRIVAFGPKEGEGANKKAFTIAGIGLETNSLTGELENLYNSVLEGKIKNKEDYKKIKLENSKFGFSGDFSLATSAQMHHPSSLLVTGEHSFIFSDTGNNLVRKVFALDYGQCKKSDGTKKINCEIQLKNNQNLIETIIGNPLEVVVASGSGYEIRQNLKAPEAGNQAGDAKKSKLNLPLGLVLTSPDQLYFLDNLTGSDLLHGKLNLYEGNDKQLSGSGEVSFLKNFGKNLNPDKVSMGSIEDFISSSPLNKMIFERKTDGKFELNGDQKSQELLGLDLELVNYPASGKAVITNIKTSISPRKIISR